MAWARFGAWGHTDVPAASVATSVWGCLHMALDHGLTEAGRLWGLLGESFLVSSWADIPAFGLGLAFFTADRPLCSPSAFVRQMVLAAPGFPSLTLWRSHFLSLGS